MTYHHATNNGGVDSVGNKSLLSRFEESSKGSLNLLLVGSIKLLRNEDGFQIASNKASIYNNIPSSAHLGSGNGADHLSSVRRHQGVEGGNDGLGEAKSGGEYGENSLHFREGP